MRKSRVLLVGVAVAAAAAATSAFTGGNTLPTTGDSLTAGYGKVTVSGATVTDVAYNPLSSDKSLLDNVVFTTTTDVTSTGLTATMILKNGSTVIGNYGCNKSTYSSTMTLTCAATGNPVISSFDTVGLTIVH